MMQVSSSAPDVGAVGLADLIGSAPQPDPLEELYAVAGTGPGSASASPLAELAELASFIAAVRAARAGRPADADSRRDAVHVSRLAGLWVGSEHAALGLPRRPDVRVERPSLFSRAVSVSN